jgi:hypothetical protein
VQATISLDPRTLEDSKKNVGPPSITFLGDISGSMQPNMQSLLNSILALIDMCGPDSSVRVILFDDTPRTILPWTLLSADNSDLKEHVKYSVENYGRGTNLELALYAVLGDSESQQTSDPAPHLPTSRSLTLFASDGLANLGRETSADLLEFARSFKSYGQETFYTLGIRTDPLSQLNSELLKDLALDSCGTFSLTKDTEGIAKSIGDVLADHYFVEYTHVKVQCKSSNGLFGTLCTRVSPRGATLRSDKSLTLTWEFPLEAKEPFELIQTRKNKRGETEELNETLKPGLADQQQIEQIIGCAIVAPALDKLLTKETLSLKLKQLKEFLKQNSSVELEVHIKSIQECLDSFDIGGEQNAEVSWHSYAMSSGGGAEVSMHANDLRIIALQCSQAQEEFDSQKTEESETTKRLRTK